MYRTTRYSDIAYVFTAASDARPAKRADRADTRYVIQLSDKVRLIHPVKLQIRATPALSKWHCTDLRIKKSGIVKSDYRKLIAELERRADFLAETS